MMTAEQIHEWITERYGAIQFASTDKAHMATVGVLNGVAIGLGSSEANALADLYLDLRTVDSRDRVPPPETEWERHRRELRSRNTSSNLRPRLHDHPATNGAIMESDMKKRAAELVTLLEQKKDLDREMLSLRSKIESNARQIAAVNEGLLKNVGNDIRDRAIVVKTDRANKVVLVEHPQSVRVVDIE